MDISLKYHKRFIGYATDKNIDYCYIMLRDDNW